MESNRIWSDVDDYTSGLFSLQDEPLEAALIGSNEAGLPEIQISYPQGQFLQTLVTAVSAKRVLEIGTLGGFSTIFLARGLPVGGSITSLELEPVHAAAAKQHLENAGLADRVTVVVGDARRSLEGMIADAHEPFDFVFIDADKTGYPAYIELVLKLSRPGTLIVADNLVRDGEVVADDSSDPDVQGVRAYNEYVASSPRLSGTIIQTVGSKGYDGFGIAVVVG